MTSSLNTLTAAANSHYQAGRFEEAAAGFEAAARREPTNPGHMFNAGNALRHLGRPRDAIAAYDAALAIAPGFAMAHHNRATCRLQIGDLLGGFQEYEWRKACPGFADDARYRLPRPWRGEDLTGKTLYVFPELFQGDLIQFSRYAVMAEQIGARVVLGAPKPMHALLRGMSSTLVLVDADAPAPDYDYQAALLTLPALFGTGIEAIPSSSAYLFAEPERVEKWRRRIGDRGLKVGLVWQGSANATQRSFPLAIPATRLSRAPGVRLISLQKVNGLEQLEALPPGLVETLGEDFDPGPDLFLDTAAAMTCCDLVVCPDTSVAHVAGGLGVPTWLALPEPGDWRWMEQRVDTPWYPSVRLVRQPSPGDWSGLFDRMTTDLAAIAGRTPSGV